ncbi:hypothetical protein FOA52_011738 [Chlamydomonas sp. UWO 241]|nr:hypothetical protein FOA52_011738 [Chlamydomonas sp. UWO 241]
MARWQLQKAGQREEHFCRFCSSALPDWKRALVAPAPVESAAAPEPIMVVTLGDVVHRLQVKPGPDGMREFQATIRSLFQIPEDVEFEVSFRCKAPTAIYDEKRGAALDTIQLDGIDSYEAATHCASLMAARRLATGDATFMR